MKKQLKMLSLLLVFVVGTFALANKTILSPANATYVEGPITQDTVWTLTDSPYVISKNITILPTANLTIEPGVEVRFGGRFSITVEGRLYAVGTESNNITFTSNRDQPNAGNWATIKFNGATTSNLQYCIIKYAVNGTTIQNSNLEIKSSEVSNCSQNGIAVLDGSVIIENSQISGNSLHGITIKNSVLDAKYNTISDNLAGGIYIGGTSQATIQNNIIRANANGVVLTGNSTISASITQNNVLSNTQSGINLDVKDCSNIAILYNILSANDKGFHVSGEANTQITNNSISYNNVGIFYKEANHIARWNDIYGNKLGMDLSSDANVTINAEYNYWGDESGPYHATLNPSGIGNPVSGNGEDLDFIFFLTAPIGYINQRPLASLLTDKSLVSPNQDVWFIATNSSDDGCVAQYLYDFGDGTNSGWTTLSIFVHKYTSTGTFTARVTVKDDFDVANINAASVGITVQALPQIEVSITFDRSTVASEAQVPIIVWASVGTSNIRLISITRDNLAISFGSTNSTGHFITTFTAPKVTEQANVRIIATASKSGYADGSNYKYLLVLPILSVEVAADLNAMKSGAISYVTVDVTSNANPISDAAVTLSASNGSLSAETGYTDSNGSLVLTFTGPQVKTQINVTIMATATKSGYVEGEGQTKVTVNPLVLSVQITASPTAIEAEASSRVTVHVTEDASPVEGANVTVSSNLGGDFSATTGNTDSKGDFAFIFTAPKTDTQIEITITASATKSGYVEGEQQKNIIVSPPPSIVGGLPLTTILLIVIPVIIVVIVAVLIKMKIISIARE